MSPSLPACARWPLRRLPAPEPRAEAPATPRSSPRRWSRPAPRTPAYLVPSEPRASMLELARHWPRLRHETPSWARGGSGPRGGEAGWAVDPPRRLIWARGGEARGEGAAAGVSAFRAAGGAGRQRGPLSLGGRSAGRRGQARAEVVARRSAPTAGGVRVGVPGRALPRLLPAAFWRVSPPRSRDARLDAGLARPSSWRDRAAAQGPGRGAEVQIGVPTPPFPQTPHAARPRLSRFVRTGAGALGEGGAGIHAQGKRRVR